MNVCTSDRRAREKSFTTTRCERYRAAGAYRHGGADDIEANDDGTGRAGGVAGAIDGPEPPRPRGRAAAAGDGRATATRQRAERGGPSGHRAIQGRAGC